MKGKEKARLRGAYKRIAGSYDFGDFTLQIDYVQGDPFASPSRLRAVFSADVAQVPADLLHSVVRRAAAADHLNRRLSRELGPISRSRGSGRSGIVRILRPGQQVLERTSLQMDESGQIVARISTGLPASGRRVLGHKAAEMLLSDIPGALRRALAPATRDMDALRRCGPSWTSGDS